jgi:hypothetical protein
MFAVAAKCRKTSNYVIARFYVGHIGAHGFYDSCGFVAKYGGQLVRVRTVLEV